MKAFLKFVFKLSITTHVTAGAALVFMMVVTLSEVIMRAFGKPIVGSYEIISFTGGIVISFAIPFTTWRRGHVYVDAVINRFSEEKRGVMNVTTRVFAILLFLLACWNFISMGMDLYKTGELSTTLRLPFYPIAYAMGVSCFIQCILLFADIVKILGGQYE